MMYRWGYEPYNNFWGFPGGIIPVVFWILTIIVIVSFVRMITHGSKDSNQESDNKAINILKERYAKGEINKKEFEEKKKDLS